MSFISFFKSDIKFGAKLRFRPGPARGAVIGRDAGAAPRKLGSNGPGAGPGRHGIGHLQTAQGEGPGALKQLGHGANVAVLGVILNPALLTS